MAFIHPLEATANWTEKGPQFVFGERITTKEVQPTLGVVNGFVTQSNRKLLVLIWFNETDKYQQLRPDQIQPDKTTLPTVPLMPTPTGNQNTGQTCLSGCTLLASPSGGMQMREVRPGTCLINKKGNRVRVTNVYFSTESSVMAQISQHCHASITHPMLDAKGAGQTQPTVTVAQWYT